jgi:hypothetical protein
VIVIAEPFIIDAEADARIEEFQTRVRTDIAPADDGSTERVIGGRQLKIATMLLSLL